VQIVTKCRTSKPPGGGRSIRRFNITNGPTNTLFMCMCVCHAAMFPFDPTCCLLVPLLPCPALLLSMCMFMCHAAMCKPNSDGTGWLYSANLLDLVRQYKAAFPSLFAALDPSSGGGGGWGDQGGGQQQGGGDGERQKLRAGDLFPNAPPEQHDTLLQQVRESGGLLGLLRTFMLPRRCFKPAVSFCLCTFVSVQVYVPSPITFP
jgi:hypothetical protein